MCRYTDLCNKRKKIVYLLNSCHESAGCAHTDFNVPEHPQGNNNSSITGFTLRSA